MDFVITNYYILALSGELSHFNNNNDKKIEKRASKPRCSHQFINVHYPSHVAYFVRGM